jgi:hypothetical protein
MSEPFKKKVNSAWFRQKEEIVHSKTEKVETVTTTKGNFSEWSSPEVLKKPEARTLLEAFADACCPEVQLYIVQRWMQNANRLILSRANENFVRSGGLGQVLKDLKRAEKVISHVYGLDVKDE